MFFAAGNFSGPKPYRALSRPAVFPMMLFLTCKLHGKGHLIDEVIHTYDKQTLRLYIPVDYKNFSTPKIQDGNNVEFKIGMNLWDSDGFFKLVDAHIKPLVVKANNNLETWEKISSIMCSVIMPDRCYLPEEI